MQSYKLNWSVQRSQSGDIVRRKQTGEIMLDLDLIDVEWTHTDGFPEDTIQESVSKDTLQTRKVGARKVIADQVTVHPDVTDATVCVILDQKRRDLARALGVSI